jgi:hypothetical protein
MIDRTLFIKALVLAVETYVSMFVLLTLFTISPWIAGVISYSIAATYTLIREHYDNH